MILEVRYSRACPYLISQMMRIISLARINAQAPIHNLETIHYVNFF